MSETSFETLFAFLNAARNHRHDARWTETEPFPLRVYLARRKFPIVGVAEGEGVLIGDDLVVGEDPDEAHASMFCLCAHQGTVELERAWPCAKVTGLALGSPLTRMLHS